MNLAGVQALIPIRLIHVIDTTQQSVRPEPMSDFTMIAVAIAMFGVVLMLAFVPGRISRALAARAEIKRKARRRH